MDHYRTHGAVLGYSGSTPAKIGGQRKKAFSDLIFFEMNASLPQPGGKLPPGTSRLAVPPVARGLNERFIRREAAASLNE
jgi:hypothetical protein